MIFTRGSMNAKGRLPLVVSSLHLMLDPTVAKVIPFHAKFHNRIIIERCS